MSQFQDSNNTLDLFLTPASLGICSTSGCHLSEFFITETTTRIFQFIFSLELVYLILGGSLIRSQRVSVLKEGHTLLRTIGVSPFNSCFFKLNYFLCRLQQLLLSWVQCSCRSCRGLPGTDLCWTLTCIFFQGYIPVLDLELYVQSYGPVLDPDLYFSRAMALCWTPSSRPPLLPLLLKDPQVQSSNSLFYFALPHFAFDFVSLIEK